MVCSRNNLVIGALLTLPLVNPSSRPYRGCPYRIDENQGEICLVTARLYAQRRRTPSSPYACTSLLSHVPRTTPLTLAPTAGPEPGEWCRWESDLRAKPLLIVRKVSHRSRLEHALVNSVSQTAPFAGVVWSALKRRTENTGQCCTPHTTNIAWLT